MDELKVPENYSSLSRYQCIVGVFLSFLILGLYLGEVLTLHETEFYINNYLMLMIYCVYFIPLIVMMISDFTFLFWIRYIKIKFVQLNAVLQSMLTTTIDSPQHKRVLKMKDNWEDDSSLSTHYGTYKAYENLAKLKRVKQIHLELMKCASILNEAYGLQMLISIFSSIRDFMYQSIQNRLKFTVCGFYDLDHTLIYNMIGSIITYLVIFLQIGDKPKSLFNNAIHNSTSMM
uniref:Gustatory receptor n=1 Tax=Vespula pensylvanica TaxID=30213 RepID=A0A834UDW3_VESPE|nr:hypothetical protein H0235_002540 [Vespula pensylvanica]